MNKKDILMEECSSIIFDSNNETLKMLLEKLVEIVREHNDIFEEIADLDFLDYIMKMDINEYLIGTNGDNFELRLKEYMQRENLSVEIIWQGLSQLIWDLTVPVTKKICPLCRCDNLTLLVDKEKKHIYKSCENCFYITENGMRIMRPNNLFPASIDMIKKYNYMQQI